MSPGEGGIGSGSELLERCAEVLALKAPLVAGAEISLLCGERSVGVVPAHRHDQLEIDLLFAPAAGTFKWWPKPDEGHAESVSGPGVLIVAPHLLHACQWDKEADVLVMYLEPQQFGTMFANGSAEIFASLPLAAQDLALWQVAKAIRGIYDAHIPAEAPTLHYLGLALCHHAADLLHRVIPRQINRVAEDVVRRVREFISRNLASNLCADDLARVVDYSTGHLTALFKEAIKLTPTDFLLQLRMDKANELLRTGLMTIGEVAAKVGYVDQSSFSDRFLEHWGYSAKHAIRQARAESANRPKIS